MPTFASEGGVLCRLNPSKVEVRIKSAAMMLGYYQEPELTDQTFTTEEIEQALAECRGGRLAAVV